MAHPVDASNLYSVILDTPKQLATGFDIAKDIRVAGDFQALEISGMGGSALPANLFRIYLHDLWQKDRSEKPLAIYQNRSYGLPPEAYDRCLNFICSYSGNTEETVASFEEALAHKLPCIAFSGGGKVEALARENGVPHVKLPIPNPQFQPRMGTGFFFGAMFQVLVNQGLVRDTREALLNDNLALQASFSTLEETGRALAKKMVGRTPVIYATPRYKSVAMVWKIKLNENAKTPAFWNFFPELNHNEMVGFTNPQGKFFILMLRDPEADPRILKRYDTTASLLREKGVGAEILDMSGESVYAKIFTSIALSDFTSYFLALEYGQDPTPVDMVEDLKRLLAS